MVRFAAEIASPKSVRRWTVCADGVSISTDWHAGVWTDGTEFKPVRRERPWLLIENGKIAYLFNAVFDGEKTWNQPVPLATDVHSVQRQ